MTKTLYLIDGSGFIFRAYHSLPPLTNPEGTPVGAVLGFINMMMKLVGSHEADYMAVIFDAGRITFRNEIYPDYKANRDETPEDLIPQFPLVREATTALGLPAIEQQGFEADDLIATYATQARDAGMNVVIVSSDKDLMQLVGNGVTMFDAMKNKKISADQVVEKFGVTPDKVLDVLSLMGDSSDNVPGVPGIGPKTAAELIGQFGDLDTLLDRAGEIKQNKRRENMIEYRAQAELSRELIRLKHDVPNLPAIDSFAVSDVNIETLTPFLQTHGFKSVLAKLGKPETRHPAGNVVAAQDLDSAQTRSVSQNDTKERIIIRDEATLKSWIARAQQKGMVAFDTETTSLNALQAELVGFSLCVESGESCYVPLGHKNLEERHSGESRNPDDLFNWIPDQARDDSLAPNQIPLAQAVALLKPLLENDAVLKIGHNIKYDMLVMRQFDITIAPYDDTMLLSYALHAGEHGQGMDELAERYLGYNTIKYEDVAGKGKSQLRFDEVDIDKAGEYAAEDADVTLRMWEFFKPQLAGAGVLTLYERIERPLVAVLARMEEAGITIDTNKLRAQSSYFATRMAELESDIHKLAGHEFNVGSPKQLGEVLFEEMGITGGKKSSKTGAYSTGSEVLELLAEQGHEIAEKTLEWRQMSKLKSTYTDSLPEEINPRSKRVHTSFAQSITSTGRLSSNSPNLQNIPIRTEEGKKIREAFIAKPGFELVSADYSQIELRLLAHVADIGVLKDAFKNGDDIHSITASQMFDVPLSEVSGDLRRSAKMINFGIIYGISAHGLATRLGIGRSEAAEYIERYFKQYPGIRDYMEHYKEFARKHGYVETLFGRRCHLPGIHDKNAARRQFSERAAINAPLQGTAADIIKRAMVEIDKKLSFCGLAKPAVQDLDSAQALCASQNDRMCTMLLQVHDELVFEVDSSQIDAIKPLIKKAMEGAAHLSVPLTVEVGSGPHWGAAH